MGRLQWYKRERGIPKWQTLRWFFKTFIFHHYNFRYKIFILHSEIFELWIFFFFLDWWKRSYAKRENFLAFPPHTFLKFNIFSAFLLLSFLKFIQLYMQLRVRENRYANVFFSPKMFISLGCDAAEALLGRQWGNLRRLRDLILRCSKSWMSCDAMSCHCLMSSLSLRFDLLAVFAFSLAPLAWLSATLLFCFWTRPVKNEM